MKPTEKPPAKKDTKRGRDETRTARAVAHLERLTAAKGKRLVVDLDEPAAVALESLLSVGYGSTKAEVVRQSLVDVAKRKIKNNA